MGSKGCDDVTVGYWYYVGMHMALCHGPVDYLLNIKVAGRCAWGGQQGQGTISIDNPELFGGEDREGGIVGDVDVMLGGPGQAANTYLAGQLGAQPAYRQVTSIVLNQVNIGLNPYPKMWQVRARRIETRQNGLDQWYKEKASILATICEESCTSTKGNEFSVFIALDAGRSTQFNVTKKIMQENAVNDLILKIRALVDSREYKINFGMTKYHGRRNHVQPQAGHGGECPAPECPYDPGISYLGTDAYHAYDVTSSDEIIYATDVLITFGDGMEWNVVAAAANVFFPHGGAPKLLLVVTDGHTNPWSCWSGGVPIMGWTPCPSVGERFAVNAGANLRSGIETGVFLNGSDAAAGYVIKTGWDVNPLKYTTIDDLGDALIAKFDGFVAKVPGVFKPGELQSETVYDMNPAHIIRECLTDPDWGMGYPESDMDDAAFTVCADTLYDEVMGMSLLWDKQLPLEDFVMEILKHINAVLYVSRLTGKFVLKLIRDDYDINTILELNEDHIVSVSSAKRTSFGELVNSVTVQYWDTCTGEDASLTIADQALVSMQGNTINTTVQYPGFTHRAIASQVCLRDLRTLSTPLLGCTVYANRYAADLNVGDVFVMRWPDLNIDGLVMRVVGMAYGDGRNNAVQIQCSEDVFGYSLVVVAGDDPDDPGWEDPIKPPVPVVHQLAVESPYYELIQRLGETAVNDALADDPLLGYAGAAGVQPGAAMKSNLYTDAGAGYAKRGSLPFCATATLTNSIAIQQTVFDYENEIDIHHASVGEHAQIEGELVRIDAIDTTAKTLTVGRGVLDTCIRAHPAGARIYFWDADHGVDRTTYVDGESIDVKLLPVTGKGELQIADATAMQVTLAHRAVRPYPPAGMQVDGVSYPSNVDTSPVVITWAHRDRLQQTDGNLYDDTQAGIGPEANTEYLIQVFDDTDTEVINLPNIVGNTQSVDISALVDGDAYEMHLSATRDGYESWQANIWAFINAGPSPNDFIAASYDPDTFELKQEVVGVGGETCVHGGVLSPDKDGIYHAIPANTPVWKRSRIAHNEMISDSGFDDPNEWLLEACTTISGGKANCTGCAKILSTKNTPQFNIGHVYSFSFDYVKTAGSSFSLTTEEGSTVFSSPVMGGSGTFSESFICPANTAGLALHAQGAEFTGSIDDFKAWKQEYFADDGAGVLLDPLPWLHYQKTAENVCLYNRDFNNAVWVDKETPTKVQDQVGITGRPNTAWTITDNNSAEFEEISQLFAIPDDNSSHTALFFVKKDNDTSRFPKVSIQCYDGTTHIIGQHFINTQTGGILIRDVDAVGVVYSSHSIGEYWAVLVQLPNNSTGNTTLHLIMTPAGASEWGSDKNDPTAIGSAVFDMPCLFLNTTLEEARAYLPSITQASPVSTDETQNAWAAANHDDIGKYSFDIDYHGGDVSVLSMGGVDVLSVSAGNLLLTDGTNTAQLSITDGEHHIEADFSGSNLILDLDGVTDTVPYDGSLGSGDISVGVDIRRLERV